MQNLWGFFWEMMISVGILNLKLVNLESNLVPCHQLMFPTESIRSVTLNMNVVNRVCGQGYISRWHFFYTLLYFFVYIFVCIFLFTFLGCYWFNKTHCYTYWQNGGFVGSPTCQCWTSPYNHSIKVSLYREWKHHQKYRWRCSQWPSAFNHHLMFRDSEEL